MDNTTAPSWPKIWVLFDTDEQRKIAEGFAALLKSKDVPQLQRDWLFERLAMQLSFRPQSLQRISEARLADYLRRFATRVFDHEEWVIAFHLYYLLQGEATMQRFFDLLEIPLDENGAVPADFTLEAARVTEAIRTLGTEFPVKKVARMLGGLCLENRDWVDLHEHWDRLSATLVASEAPLAAGRNSENPGLQSRDAVAAPGATVVKDAVSAPTASPTATDRPRLDGQTAVSTEFTTLDRVLIEQIIATASSTEGALEPDQLMDLIETVLSLGTSWHRGYFHLGFMDALLPERGPSFDRPELNDTRREWYLAGLLAGYVRRRKLDELREVLSQRARDFARAAKQPGGAGAALGRTVFPALLEAGHLNEAMQLLHGQFSVLGPTLGEPALDHAAERLRANDLASAQAILNVLDEVTRRRAPGDDGAAGEKEFRMSLQRRLGQLRQAQGNFVEARKILQAIVGDAETPTDLLADLGLVTGGFKSLAELRLPESDERRRAMLEGLKKGERRFEEAVGCQQGEATNGHYALAMLHYLCFMDEQYLPADEHRERALLHAQQAITGMRRSSVAAAYESLGLLGQALFIQAVAQMASLEAVAARSALASWTAISAGAGSFPRKDVRFLLEHAELVDEDSAVLIAESIWRRAERDALEILGGGKWVERSPFLRDAIVKEARNETNPRTLRWELWGASVPALLKAGDITQAAEGLDALEALADSPTLQDKLLSWLGTTAHYDPAWGEDDVAWARVRLCRTLGRDGEAAALLRELFFRVRDKELAAARGILELFGEFGLEKSHYADLQRMLEHMQAPDEGDPSLEERLRAGERVAVMFVGGNEIQSQYDGIVQEQLRREWPGLTVHFEHTGWSSNWGRELNRLIALSNGMDAVVLMTMMRTMLGRELRSRLAKPWTSCAATGKGGMVASIRRAALVGLGQRKQTK